MVELKRWVFDVQLIERSTVFLNINLTEKKRLRLKFCEWKSLFHLKYSSNQLFNFKFSTSSWGWNNGQNCKTPIGLQIIFHSLQNFVAHYKIFISFMSNLSRSSLFLCTRDLNIEYKRSLRCQFSSIQILRKDYVEPLKRKEIFAEFFPSIRMVKS